MRAQTVLVLRSHCAQLTVLRTAIDASNASKNAYLIRTRLNERHVETECRVKANVPTWGSWELVSACSATTFVEHTTAVVNGQNHNKFC